MVPVIPSILALDISLRSTGWAVGSPDCRPRWGVLPNPKGGEWDNDKEHLVLARFRAFLADHHARSQLTHIAFESIFIDVRNPKKFQFNGTDAQLMYKGIVLEFCGTHGILPAEQPVAQWRARFLGKDERAEIRNLTEANTEARRKEWKRAVTLECTRRGWFVETDDEADALGILDFVLSATSRQHAGRTDPIFRRNQLRGERERYFGS